MERRIKVMPTDRTMPTGKWEFNNEVTAVFDDMLQRSIPDYSGMRRTTTELALRFCQNGTYVVDLGCSRGAALKPIIEASNKKVNYLGIEVSEPMRAAAVKELVGKAEIVDLDLRDVYPNVSASVTLSVLTLQFIPIEYRQRIIQNAFDNTIAGGAFLLVEKVLGADAFSDRLLVETYYDRKGENGYSTDQITAKRRSLEGVLVPVTADWNVEMLKQAGFKHVECYWRHLNFAAWIGVKQ
jgi:tRNA (cmo5U34)-methyltransferase